MNAQNRAFCQRTAEHSVLTDYNHTLCKSLIDLNKNKAK